jgi:hypothetical protein
MEANCFIRILLSADALNHGSDRFDADVETAVAIANPTKAATKKRSNRPIREADIAVPIPS